MKQPGPVPSEQARMLIALMSAGAPDAAADIRGLRQHVRQWSLAGSGTPESVASVESIEVHDVPARLYRPLLDERDALVWLHGGAWMVGDLDSYDALARGLANRVGCAVLSVDYRLAPEHTYPDALEDCWRATVWASEQFDRVAVGGDSAGGNLAAAVALRARDRSIELALQLLVYPMLDYAAVDGAFYNEYSRLYRTFAGIEHAGALTQSHIRNIWEIYLPDPSQRAEHEASPLQATSFSGVAPVLIIAAEHDILRGEGEEYARRLQADGVAAELVNYPGQVHGFFHLIGLMDDARDSLERSAAALRCAFAR
jgi:acetyl esterase